MAAPPAEELGLVRLLRGQASEAAVEYRRLEGPEAYASSLGAAGLADLALYGGRLGEARKILETAIASELENGLNAFAIQKKIALAEALFSLGRPDDALKSVEGALAGTSNESVQFACAMILVRAGRESRARELAESLAVLPSPEPQAYARLIRGEIDLAQGRYPEAIREIHEAQAQVDTWIGHFALGRAYLEAGQFTEAYSEFESCWKRRGETASIFLDDLPTLRYLPPVHYYLGRAQEGLKIPAAAESYKRYLEIKILAEGDPLVEDAKRRLGAL
ncbi:MAG: tetratricopeptide repeat protein [Candidatus Aminicenantes bacterium]|nr:tetratricopeptide repeat protein [Candidatus Aminicenantes bacterium]